MLSTMSDPDRTVSNEDLVELQKKFSEIKHAINNALAVMMALSEMSQRRPDYSAKLASTGLTKAPHIVSSLQDFSQALNERPGPRREAARSRTVGCTYTGSKPSGRPAPNSY